MPLPATAATPTKPQRPLRQEIRRRVIALTVCFVGYVLAIGPLYWQYYDAKFNEGPAWVAALYEPLYWFCFWCPPFGRLVDGYVRLWII